MTSPFPKTEEEVLLHLCRHRITTVPAISAAVLPGKSEKDIRAVLRALETKGLIGSRPLIAKRVYFQLTPRGAREFGQPEEVAKPLGPQALPKWFGVLAFCCLSGPQRQRITRDEFEEVFHELLADGVPFNDYFLDGEGDATTLCRIIVDLGGDADRFIRKILHIAQSLADAPSAARLLDSDRFRFSVVTTSPHKEAALIRAAEKICPSIPVEVTVVPELLQIIPDFYG